MNSISKYTITLFMTMTVLLEYIDGFYNFPQMHICY